MSSASVRCAIYTRKSSDEGLDQSFNSLDAQREAGEAYVKSQSHEGWTLIPTLYDDGGYSGGSMERPALKRLLADVEKRLVDVVVVYKIDRLTRSLADFARIVELFDRREVSFVSVTQSFNTTSSMGRLTLNVLLSFAQFEREVTGERIRDKIAASKAKGMWMGGNVPLGFDPPDTGTRIIRINEAEAQTVRHIFARYLELPSVHALQRELQEQGIVSKQRTTGSGRSYGGCPINRGSLYHMLANPIYIGKIRHRDTVHEGGHDAIVSQVVFDKVQKKLARQPMRKREKGERRYERSLLTGRLYDGSGDLMTPTWARGSKGRYYRYYASASLLRGRAPDDEEMLRRIAAPAFERILNSILARWLPSASAPLSIPGAIHLAEDGLLIDLPAEHGPQIAARLASSERIIHVGEDSMRIYVPLALPLRGGKRLIVASTAPAPQPDAALIAALRKAHTLVARKRGQPIIEAAPASVYERRVQRLAFLAPDLQRDILTGHQPHSLSLEKLRYTEIPLSWKEQREVLGWPQRDT